MREKKRSDGSEVLCKVGGTNLHVETECTPREGLARRAGFGSPQDELVYPGKVPFAYLTEYGTKV